MSPKMKAIVEDYEKWRLSLIDELSNLDNTIRNLQHTFEPGDWVRYHTYEGTVEEVRGDTIYVRTASGELKTPNRFALEHAE